MQQNPCKWSPLFGHVIAAGAIAFAPGCSEGPGDAVAPVDSFAEIPATPQGSIQWDFPEQIIEAGTEVQLCYFMEKLPEDIFITSLTSYQGPFGHHLVIFRAEKEETPGTVRDCTAASDMVNLSPVISSVNFGLQKFPDGMAIRVPAATQPLLQLHIVNTSDKPIRVRDAVHVNLVAQADVQLLAGFYGVSNIDFVLPPHATSETTFDCEVPRDMNLLLMGPHMHEWGTVFEATAGPIDNLKPVIDIQKWQAEMRDAPPVVEFPVDAPFVLKAGDVVRTHCIWNNTTTDNIIFPHEMCATYGYYYPAPLGSEAWTCGSSTTF